MVRHTLSSRSDKTLNYSCSSAPIKSGAPTPHGGKHMRTFVSFFAFLATIVIAAPTAVAEIDPIGPITAVEGQPIDLNFPNITLPPPSRKLMSFTGMAEASGAPRTAILGIHFDYVDPITGVDVIVPLPNFYQEAVSTGAGLVPINAGPVILPFCPELVSIHFENLTPFTEITFSGDFQHVCIPVPEPATLSLVLISGLACIGGRRSCLVS